MSDGMPGSDGLSLDDKYVRSSGPVFLTGMQALVRLALDQRRFDAARGLNTAGFVSGYRGSPIGGFDRELWRAGSLLDEHHIRFQPAVNEEIAATSIWGSQQVPFFPNPRYEGVFGIWYGKGPGLDRSGDAIRHANQAGSSPHGGVLAVVGDDHTSKSSAFGAQSEYAFVDFMMPVLSPAGVSEFVELGLKGFAMSRFSGVWTGFKLAGVSAESSTIVDVPSAWPAFAAPDVPRPPEGLHIRQTEIDRGAYEARLKEFRLPAAVAFARANALDHTFIDGPDARVGILTAGKAYLDTRQALADLDLGTQAAAALGVRARKLALVWPLEPEGLIAFASGLELILVVEEKRGLVEDQVKTVLYEAYASGRLRNLPRVLGKRDEAGSPLLSESRELDAITVAETLVPRLVARGAPPTLSLRLSELQARRGGALGPDILKRTPYFCSGCPHNRSTVLPEGSLAIGGIGCHTLAMGMDRGIHTFTHMGGEGASWIGISPFTELEHVFQNVGDGTYFHSAQLCVRAAVAANVSMTFKILYNDAVAMTGGQPLDGTLTVPQLTHQLEAEGIRRIALVADDPEKYPADAGIAPLVTIHHRNDLDAVQRELADVKGVSALIYDQTCAAEKRRRRKRNAFPDPARRVVINEMVCEGCGDCGIRSNCLSVTPAETAFGTKRRIDQSSCNKDFSCLEGFCPSFMTVEGGSLRKSRGQPLGEAAIAEPVSRPQSGPRSVLIAGIGGTGIVTVGALLGMAARIEGRPCTVNDVTGAAQKGGLVASHVIIGRVGDIIHAERIGAGAADVLIAADLVVASNADILSRIGRRTSYALVNSDRAQTGAFLRDPKARFPEEALRESVTRRLGDASCAEFLAASTNASALTGDVVGANLLMLGIAWQRGWIPLDHASITRAVELNGVAVKSNLDAFEWGRRLAAGAAPSVMPAGGNGPLELDALVAHRVSALTRYQGVAYAAMYRDLVSFVRQAEAERVPGETRLATAVAQFAYKLMAYKDEYEVARLLSDPEFHRGIAERFEGDYVVNFHLAPPLLARRDPATGHLRKGRYGPWMRNAMSLLARLRFLRGTPLDPFGYTKERRAERALVDEYLATMRNVASGLTAANHADAVSIACVPDDIRGYGHVKERSLEKARVSRTRHLDSFIAHAAPIAASRETV